MTRQAHRSGTEPSSSAPDPRPATDPDPRVTDPQQQLACLRALLPLLADVDGSDPDGRFSGVIRYAAQPIPRPADATTDASAGAGVADAGAAASTGEKPGAEDDNEDDEPEVELVGVVAPLADPGVIIDLITATEQAGAALAATHARLAVALAAALTAAAEARGISRRQADRSIAPQLGLARRCSPGTADRHLAFARAATSVLPDTFALLTAGTISHEHATAVHRATTGLTPTGRLRVDQRIAPRLPALTPRQAETTAAGIAAEVDAAAIVARHAAAVNDRGLWTRPAPDGMAYLTVLGDLTDVIGAYASLRRHADAVLAGTIPEDPPGERTYAQILTDTALHALSGRLPGQIHPVRVNLVMHPDALFGPGRTDPLRPTAPKTTSNPAPHHSPHHPQPDQNDPDKPSTHDEQRAHRDRPEQHERSQQHDQSEQDEPSTHGEQGAHRDRSEQDDACEQHDQSEHGEPGHQDDPAGPHEHHEPGTTPDHTAEQHDRRTQDHPGQPTPTPRAGQPTPDQHSEQVSATRADPPPERHRPGDGTRCAGANIPVRIVGHGYLPAPLARALLRTDCDTPDTHPATVLLRRTFTSPDGTDLIALESTSRLFPAALRDLLILRDDVCRMPHCAATIRHADHIHPHRDHGPTTLANGQGLSARCNHTKDLPGFTTHVLTPDEITAYATGDPDHPNTHIARAAGPATHVTEVRTPTGHRYLSANPPALTPTHPTQGARRAPAPPATATQPATASQPAA